LSTILTLEHIQSSLISFIRENLVAETVQVDAQTPLADMELDSFSIIELVLFIERKFGVILPDVELTRENVYSVQTLSETVLRFASQ
jgi:acyl carrier protein